MFRIKNYIIVLFLLISTISYAQSDTYITGDIGTTLKNSTPNVSGAVLIGFINDTNDQASIGGMFKMYRNKILLGNRLFAAVHLSNKEDISFMYLQADAFYNKDITESIPRLELSAGFGAKLNQIRAMAGLGVDDYNPVLDRTRHFVINVKLSYNLKL